MSIEATEAYLHLINEFVNTCSTVVPAVAWLLRLIKVIKPKPTPNVGDQIVSQVFSTLSIIGFGFMGGVLGLLITIVFGVVTVIFVGLTAAEISSNGAISFVAPEIQVPKIEFVYAGCGLGMTLLAFGLRNGAKALGFITGVLGGITLGLLIMLSILFGR